MKIILRNYKDYSPSVKAKRKKELVSFYNKNFPLSQWDREYFDNFLDDKNEKKMSCLVLEENKKVAGFIMGRVVGKIKKRLNLTTILIDKKYRKKGLSKILLDNFLKITKQNKSIKKVYLHFRDSNNFQNFYARYGFKNHRITGHYSNGEKKHYMEITL